ncbi:MAG: M14 family metallopeptidase [Planctomycetales bacterium]|nr:M14 family metallopeptidase [Planctomycetales bacterium]
MDAPLLTKPERTGCRETSTHAEVVDFLRRLARRTRFVRLHTFGRTPEGRPMVAATLSAARAFTPEAAERKGLLRILVIANIHAGEVEGKEACQMLLRDWTVRAPGGRPPAWLRKCVIVFVPDYNADGNDRINTENRRLDLKKLDGQIGPDGGAGTRYTGQGINLNRDYMKQEAPETIALSRLFGLWWPHLTVDCHTTDGSIHGYHLTYDTAHTAKSGPIEPIEFVNMLLLEELRRELAGRGVRTFFYGNYRDQTDPTKGWQTYSPLPRYGSHYRGLTGRADVLLETYSYIPFRQRVQVMSTTLEQLLQLASRRARGLQEIVRLAERKTVEAPTSRWRSFLGTGIAYGVSRSAPRGRVVFEYPVHPLSEPADILGWDRKTILKRRISGGTLTKYRVQHFREFIATRSVSRPLAYLVPRDLARRLLTHNIRVERLSRPATLQVERYVVLDVLKTDSPDVGRVKRDENVLYCRSEVVTRRLPAGTHVVPMAQPLANLAIYLLEPESDDGFARWDLVRPRPRRGAEFPVLRVNEPARLAMRRVPPPPGWARR